MMIILGTMEYHENNCLDIIGDFSVIQKKKEIGEMCVLNHVLMISFAKEYFFHLRLFAIFQQS